MSCIRSDFVKIAGDSIGVDVSDDVAKALADDIDRRVMSLVKVSNGNIDEFSRLTYSYVRDLCPRQLLITVYGDILHFFF